MKKKSPTYPRRWPWACLSRPAPQGRPFPTSPPALGRPRSSGGRTGGRLLRPIRISFHPFESAYSTRLPRHSVPLVLSAEDTGKAVGLRYGLEFPGASVL